MGSAAWGTPRPLQRGRPGRPWLLTAGRAAALLLAMLVFYAGLHGLILVLFVSPIEHPLLIAAYLCSM